MNSQQQTQRIGVVGGGLGGLAAACTLAARGYQVTLIEQNQWLGGKAAVHHDQGFRFDMGPTILMMPSVLRRIFAEAGIALEERLDLIELDPQWRGFFEDGTTLDLWSKQDRMEEALEAYAPDQGLSEGYARFMKASKRMRRVSDDFFFWRPVGGMWDMFDLKTAVKPSTLADVLSLRLGQTVGGVIRKHVPDRRVAQLLDHFTQYVGSAPDASPAVLCGIASMQTEEGVWYPKGGIRALAGALATLAAELGVELRTGERVEEFLVEDGAIKGLRTASGERLPFQAIVSNSDVVRTHQELVPKRIGSRFERRKTWEAACSGVVLYLGLKERYDHLAHHSFVFSRDPHEEFEAIYREGRPAPDPTAYLCAPAATDPTVAPEGGEALYVLVHTPYLRPDHDWSAMFPGYRQVILDKLKRTAGLEDIEDRIVCERALTPQDIHERYHVLNGAIYGLASHGRFTGAFKPSNRSPDLRGLYFAGGSAHPGPGMPMVLMSGWIAADALSQDMRAPERQREPIGAGRAG